MQHIFVKQKRDIWYCLVLPGTHKLVGLLLCIHYTYHKMYKCSEVSAISNSYKFVLLVTSTGDTTLLPCYNYYSVELI